MATRTIGIGLLGVGVVGAGVARTILQKGERLLHASGGCIELRNVLVRDLHKSRGIDLLPDLLTTNPQDVLENPEIDIVVEVLGGPEPAKDYIFQAVAIGNHVVTANKDVMAKYGPEILEAANSNGVRVLFEATVAGGTPIIAPLQRDLLANEVIAVNGSINGTTNYILTRMARDGIDFMDALTEAQELGYAEPDPTNDVEGIDAAYKLAILASIAFQTPVFDSDVYREGISKLTSRDFVYASELGYTIKLIGVARRDAEGIQARVHPAFISSDVMIAKVDGVLNAIEIETDLAGRVLFHGQGAGAMPTTSAILADVIDCSRGLLDGKDSPSMIALRRNIQIRSIMDLETKYYIRMNVVERPGVLAAITRVLGDLEISIASVIQKEVDFTTLQAEIVLITNRAKESSIQQAINELAELEVVAEIGTMVRVED